MAAYPYRLPRKYRYRSPSRRLWAPVRRRSRLSSRDAAIIVVIIIAAAGGAGGAKAANSRHHGTHRADVHTTAITIPAGSDLNTPSGWAKAFLAADSLPVTSCNFSAVTEWERREGGGFGNQASFNALNVNPGPGAGWPGHPAIGAWAFPDAATGLRYTVATLNLGYYDGIRAALRAGNSAQAVCNAIMASPWAGSHYDGTLTASC